jgi:hypothetical protein
VAESSARAARASGLTDPCRIVGKPLSMYFQMFETWWARAGLWPPLAAGLSSRARSAVFVSTLVLQSLTANGTSNYLTVRRARTAVCRPRQLPPPLTVRSRLQGLMLVVAYLLVAGGFFAHKDVCG